MSDSESDNKESKRIDSIEIVFSAFQNLRDSLFITDLNDEIILVNHAFCERYGYSLEEIVGKNVRCLWDLDDSSDVDSNSNARTLPKDISGAWIYNISKDKKRFPVQLSRSSVLNKDNELIGVVGVSRKVSGLSPAKEALEESEGRFQQLADTIDQIFWLTDAERNKWIYLSPQFEIFWGCSPETVYRNSDRFYDVIHEADRERVRNSADCIASGDYEEEYRIVRSDGVVRWVRDRAYPVLDTDGCVHRVSGTIEDITESRIAKQRNEQLEIHLRQAQKLEAIGQLAGGIAHDFNNILGSIIGYTEMALEDIDTQSLANANLREALTAANRAKRLVSQILTFSRRRVKNLRPVDFSEVIHESLQLVRATIPSTIEIQIQKQCDGDHLYVVGDVDLLYSVVLNLCTNAAQSMQQKGGIMTINLDSVSHNVSFNDCGVEISAGDYVRFVVEDTGIGIESEVLGRIFEPFFTTKPQGHGTGLGLSVAHGIIKEHGGMITVRSEIDKGTRFAVYLPLDFELADTEEPELEELKAGSGTVLFVDDEEQLVNLAKLRLGKIGYSVIGATSSLEALKLFKRNPMKFDLLITDATMPKMTGDVLGRKIQEIRSDLPMILCSGYTERVSYHEARKLGFDEFLSKPIGCAQMARVVYATLYGKKRIE